MLCIAFFGALSVKAGLIEEAFYTFDVDFKDSSGSGGTHDGTATNGAQIIRLKNVYLCGSGVLYLDGIDDYVDIGSIVRYVAVAAARNGEFHSNTVTLTTHKLSSGVYSELAADTGMVWFPFADDRIDFGYLDKSQTSVYSVVNNF